VYRWLPRLKKLFTELAVVDVLFNPVGHVDSYSKSRNLIDMSLWNTKAWRHGSWSTGSEEAGSP